MKTYTVIHHGLNDFCKPGSFHLQCPVVGEIEAKSKKSAIRIAADKYPVSKNQWLEVIYGTNENISIRSQSGK